MIHKVEGAFFYTAVDSNSQIFVFLKVKRVFSPGRPFTALKTVGVTERRAAFNGDERRPCSCSSLLSAPKTHQHAHGSFVAMAFPEPTSNPICPNSVTPLNVFFMMKMQPRFLKCFCLGDMNQDFCFVTDSVASDI